MSPRRWLTGCKSGHAVPTKDECDQPHGEKGKCGMKGVGFYAVEQPRSSWPIVAEEPSRFNQLR